MFVSIYYKPSLFNAHTMILIVHIFMNVNKLCLNQEEEEEEEEGGGGGGKEEEEEKEEETKLTAGVLKQDGNTQMVNVNGYLVS